jgi:Uma2 family endonuclease
MSGASYTKESFMAVGTAAPTLWTLADLVAMFGPIPAHRIRFDPPPGLATEEDVQKILRREKRLYELVDSVLVEKDIGFYESYLAVMLATYLQNFVSRTKGGIVTGEAGMVRLAAGLVRIPDVAFISWDRLPGRRIPRKPIPDLAPNLAVEILSKGNTKQEMERKLQDYFAAGVELVWLVDPRLRTVTVYAAPNRKRVIRSHQVLDGGSVLPDSTLPLSKLFAEPEGSSGGR